MDAMQSLMEEAAALPLATAVLYSTATFVGLGLLISSLMEEKIPKLDVPVETLESDDNIEAPLYDPKKPSVGAGEIPCYCPGSMKFLGSVPAMTAAQVQEKILIAEKSQKEWVKSSFAQRRKLLKVFLRYILDNQELICRVAARDSGKPMVDAAFGEVLVTCEKIKWVVNNGEKYLKPETRPAGYMMMHKTAKVEYVPVGVMGCIVPWNYPFHNVFNPLIANLFAGNAVVIKVSEHASWSTGLYGRIISAALKAVGAPEGLVQIITGYGEAGNALVTSPNVSKVVFVGSTVVGKKVMEAASKNLTPVVLELGGKDPFIVLDDADLNQLLPFAMRGTFQSMGQNCTGAERFIVQAGIHSRFVAAVVEQTRQLRVGPALGGSFVDCGALCMPGHAAQVHALVEDAVSKGAKVEVGGELPSQEGGQFYPPTVLTNITPDMRLWQEEVFGPVLPIMRVESDMDAVSAANSCAFGLGSSVFSRSQARALAVGDQMQAGMTSINDFAATYMSQALPFGGVKDSGFDRFAGIEGLRGCCHVKSVCVDKFPMLMKTNIPPLLQYPVDDVAFDFVSALCKLFYGFGVSDRVSALVTMTQCFVFPKSIKNKKANKDKSS